MKEEPGIRPSQWGLAMLILALALGKLAYDLLIRNELRQTAALFIGLPALLALTLALTPRAKSITGIILKGLTIALLMSGILLEEGFICILMAAPLFYAVALAVGVVLERARGRGDTNSQRRAMSVLLLPILFFSLEGVFPATTLPRTQTVAVERTVSGAAAEVEAALAEVPSFELPLPFYLRLGFPRPVGAAGAGLEIGDERRIEFSAGEMPPAALTLEVVARGPGWVRFRRVSDDTPIADWLSWETAEVRWEEIQPGATRVRWTFRYLRQLDPAWYFGPWERYAVRLAAGYLIDTLATP